MRLHIGIAVALLVIGCRGPTLPTEAEFLGTYEARLFTLELDGVTRNVIAAGGGAGLSLEGGHTATGSVFIPPGLWTEDAVVEFFDGSWSLRDSTITLTLAGAAILNGVLLTVTKPYEFAGAQVVDGATLRLAYRPTPNCGTREC